MAASTALDWDWATSTGGALTPAQRRHLTAAFVKAAPTVLPGRLKIALGRRGRGRLDFAGLRLPDSALAKAAETEARETLSDAILEHSFRTYYFGRVLATLDGAPYDDELVYVSSLLHDISLESPTPGRCFAVRGGEHAVNFATRHGATPDRARAIGAAIAAHLTPGVAANLSDPGGFVSAGASADVIGARISDLSPTWITELLHHHPRHNFKHHITTAFRAEAAAVPHGRTKWLLNSGFDPLIRLSPFPE
ncbi:phosphohydrolase [Nocardia yamanashiensis]|uniref:phosphohydrolase n=1 Tax=Nocardia yamanashiensis TaxID=209247 RepID=UPI001E5D7418|nr:phosphohydrolase [Nocardia yamanashiensis]UGT42637.1 phosphohydrolase [Nocardia yamanashiensis]